MNRRDFIFSGIALGTSARAIGSEAPFQHRLPESDFHYRKVKSYVEEVPVAGYHWASPRAYEAFNDIKFGVRIHWGIYSISGRRGESWPFLQMPFEERQRYQQLYKMWNPARFDADEWMSFFEESGLRMFAFTTKHHEGFSMFDTKTRVRRRADWTARGGPKIESCDLAYSIMETPFGRDVVKELCDAAHKRGIKIDLYFSHPDWYDTDFRPYSWHPLQVPSSGLLTDDYDRLKKFLGDLLVIVPDPTPEEVKRMMARHRAQLTELLTNYGRIDMMCLDQWLGPAVWPTLRETIIELRKLQPDVMLRARGVGNYGDYYTPEGFVPGSKENTDVPWFAMAALARSLSYDPDATKYKGARWVIQKLVDSAAKGGNFMVCLGPNADGQFHPTGIAQLRQVGDWLRVNGEGIYATRAREGSLWSEGSTIRFTRSKDRRFLYATTWEWPGRELLLSSVKPRSGSTIRLLGCADPLQWSIDAPRGLSIVIPENLQDEEHRPSQFAWTFKIEV
jgi:alpha-L-fucosidase